MFEFNHKKAVQALNYFATKEGGVINKMKAIKLIWLSDRAHIRRYGRPIIMDEYFALPFGPIPSNTKDLAENNDVFTSEDEANYRNQYIETVNKYKFRSIEPIDEKVFSKTDLMVLEKVFSVFGNLTEFDLSNLSHEFPEWKKHENSLKSKIASRFKMDYLDFFNDPTFAKESMFNESKELINLAKYMYTENVALVYGTF